MHLSVVFLATLFSVIYRIKICTPHASLTSMMKAVRCSTFCGPSVTSISLFLLLPLSPATKLLLSHLLKEDLLLLLAEELQHLGFHVHPLEDFGQHLVPLSGGSCCCSMAIMACFPALQRVEFPFSLKAAWIRRSLSGRRKSLWSPLWIAFTALEVEVQSIRLWFGGEDCCCCCCCGCWRDRERSDLLYCLVPPRSVLFWLTENNGS